MCFVVENCSGARYHSGVHFLWWMSAVVPWLPVSCAKTAHSSNKYACFFYRFPFTFRLLQSHSRYIGPFVTFALVTSSPLLWSHCHIYFGRFVTFTLVALSRQLWSLCHLYFGHLVTFILVASSPSLWSLCRVYFGHFVTLTLVALSRLLWSFCHLNFGRFVTSTLVTLSP
jgi:hypothetical protein